MMRFWRDFRADECGAVLSAELVMLATLGVIGATVGMNMTATAINEELKETAYALRSLDQSYEVKGFRGCRSWTAGSCYHQRPVAESLAELRALGADDLPPGEEPKPELKPKKADGVPDVPDTPKPKKKKKPKPDEEESAEGPDAGELAPPPPSTDA